MKEIQLKTGELLRISDATPDDAEEVIAFVNAISTESENITFGPGEFDITIQQERVHFQKIANTDNAIFIVGKIGNEVVSICDFTGGKRPRIKHTGELGLSVRKKYWRKGIGAAMMQYLIEWADNNGIRKLNLRVREDNLGAITLYEKMGFLHEGRITREFYIRGSFFSSLHMGLELDQ